MRLVQTRWPEKRTFQITDTGLAFEDRRPFQRHAGTIRFEDIGDDISELSLSSGRWLVATICFTILTLATFIMIFTTRDAEIGAPLFWSAWGILGGIMWWRSRRSIVRLNCGGGVSFVNLYADRPKEEDVQEFLRELQQRKRQYLLQRYSMAPIAAPKLPEA